MLGRCLVEEGDAVGSTHPRALNGSIVDETPGKNSIFCGEPTGVLLYIVCGCLSLRETNLLCHYRPLLTGRAAPYPKF